MQRIATRLEQWTKRLAMGKKRFLTEEVDSIRALLLIRQDLDPESALSMNARDRKLILQTYAAEHAHKGISQDFANIRVASSLISNAGEGVFCVNPSPKGTVMCIFPGTVFRPDDVYEAVHDPGCPMYNRIFKQDLQHCVSLFDGSVIDAGRESESEWTPHPFAVAHKVNHPPKGAEPNVMKLPFLWRPQIPVNAFTTAFAEDEDEEEEEPGTQILPVRDLTAEEQGPDTGGLSRFWMFGWSRAARKEEAKESFLRRRKLHEKLAPKRRRKGKNWDFAVTYSPTPEEQSVIRGLAFISTRDVDVGEELLMNYRLNPKSIHTRPKWYHPVDEKEDTARWSSD